MVSFCKSGRFLATDHGSRLARMAATANFSKPDLPNPDRRQTRILLMPAPTTIHDHGPIWFLAPHALQLHRYRSIFYRTYDSPLAQYFFRPSSVAAGRHPPCFIFIKLTNSGSSSQTTGDAEQIPFHHQNMVPPPLQIPPTPCSPISNLIYLPQGIGPTAPMPFAPPDASWRED